MTGLIGWWPLHENSGTTAYDLSGNENHGTLNGGITKGVAGKGGLTSYSFDGVDDYIGVGGIGGVSSWTISFWIYPQVVADHHNILHTNYAAGDNTGVRFEEYSNGEFKIGVSADNNWRDYSILSSLTENAWHHVVAIGGSSADSLKVYVDDNLELDVFHSSWPSNFDNLILGAGYDRSQEKRFYDGVLSDVRIYDRTLTPQEIQELHDWGNGEYARPLNNQNSSSAVSRWDFDGDVTDSWGMNDGGASTSAGYSTNSIRGKSAKFNGTDDFVDVADDSTLDIQNTITVSAWINTPKRQNRAAIVDKGGFDTYWVQKQTSDQLRFGIRDGGTAYYTDAGSSMWPENEWVHVTGTFDGNRLRIYVNGLEKSSTAHSGTIDTDTDSLQIGNSPSYNRAFEGKIDDVRIYDKALSPSEVFELYRWGTRGRDLRKLTVNSR